MNIFTSYGDVTFNLMFLLKGVTTLNPVVKMMTLANLYIRSKTNTGVVEHAHDIGKVSTLT